MRSTKIPFPAGRAPAQGTAAPESPPAAEASACRRNSRLGGFRPLFDEPARTRGAERGGSGHPTATDWRAFRAAAIERRRRYVERVAQVHTLMVAVFVASSPVPTTRPLTPPAHAPRIAQQPPAGAGARARRGPPPPTTAATTTTTTTTRTSNGSSSGCSNKSNGSRRRASGNEREIISERRTAGGVGEPKCGGDWSSANAVS